MDFRIFKPQGVLSDHVQGIWSVTVPPEQSGEEEKLLFSDAGSGILLNLGCDVCFGGHWHPAGVVLLPVSKEAQQVTMPPGTVMAGIRFHPAMGYRLLGQRFENPVAMTNIPDDFHALQSLQQQLQACTHHAARIATMYRWFKQTFELANASHQTMLDIIGAVQLGGANPSLPVGTRQIERQFQKWMGITPKHYQRILRVKDSLAHIRTSPDISLADLAVEHGFADQAHMTREFSKIAKITPKKYSLRVKRVTR
ncbi:AraC family transcriptional regulator [Photobacterium galatheae]|uniref:helix-turn-helix domain-containing protein n=1 Tax=Photobacterium galatheae TaxID=1654360 RepID=UPI00202CF0D3|nr:helix-turn-helix domain-containing protein [Photobacterium galatheae]MCM0148737.1 AraC family transcriptional regulator [Photobacterium galatheae]